MAGVRVKALGVLALATLWLAPGALAAPPANDDFDDAQVLPSGVPVAAIGTNVGSSKEVGEPRHGVFFASGHSVWFEWQATSDGLVTVGTCGSDFSTTLGVYVGASVDGLTDVVNGGGPGCIDPGEQATFEATAGTTYKIAVDGNGFFLPGGGPPGSEGNIALQIDATPTPANDDLVDAVALSSKLEEESFYVARGLGFNWNATKEPGEPSHADDPGGASVWYSWPAPISGVATVSACFGRPMLLGVYTGDSVDSLVPITSATRSFSCGVEFPANAGTVYRIAVDGRLDPKTGTPELDVFQLLATMNLVPADKNFPIPWEIQHPADTTPPQTMVRKAFLKSMPPRVSVYFESNEPGSTFRCKLDKRRYAPCQPPKRFKNLKPGLHTFKVVAVDTAGNADPTPATARFSIPKRRSR